MQVNIMDVLCLLPAVLSIIFGAKSGSVKLMIGFIFFIISIWLTYLIFPSFGEILARHMESELMINLLSVLLAYVMSTIFCSLIAKSLKKMAGDASGGFMDRMFGTLLGALRGLIVALMIFLIIVVIAGKTYLEAENLYDLLPKEEKEQPDWVKNSLSYEKMMELTNILADKIGEDYLKERKVPDFK
jgi:membrane protein required for colicin V production